jgi:hypothetical protein
VAIKEISSSLWKEWQKTCNFLEDFVNINEAEKVREEGCVKMERAVIKADLGITTVRERVRCGTWFLYPQIRFSSARRSGAKASSAGERVRRDIVTSAVLVEPAKKEV